MLTMVIVILATCGLDITLKIKPTLDFNPGWKLTIILFTITTILFWVVSVLLTKRNSDEYETIWDEPTITLYNVVYSFFTTVIMYGMVKDVGEVGSFLKGNVWIWPVFVAIDIVGIFIVYNTYSFKVKESVIDSLLLQIRNVRAAVCLMLLLVLVIKFTIFGVLILFTIVAFIPGLLDFLGKILFGKK